MDVRALGDCLLKEEKSFAQRWFARSSKIELMDLFCLFSRLRLLVFGKTRPWMAWWQTSHEHLMEMLICTKSCQVEIPNCPLGSIPDIHLISSNLDPKKHLWENLSWNLCGQFVPEINTIHSHDETNQPGPASSGPPPAGGEATHAAGPLPIRRRSTFHPSQCWPQLIRFLPIFLGERTFWTWNELSFFFRMVENISTVKKISQMHDEATKF